VDDWQEFLLNLQAYLIVGGAAVVLTAGGAIAAPYVLRRPLPLPGLRPGRWGGGEVLFALLAFALFVPNLVTGLLSDLGFFETVLGGEASFFRKITVGSPLYLALTLAMVFTVLYVSSRTRPRDLGLTAARWPANVALGAVAFLLLTVPIHTVNYLLILALGSPEEHPILRMVNEPTYQPWEWYLLVFQTVVAAPLLEETMFRGVLQGWLRRASLVGHLTVIVVALVAATVPLLAYVASQGQEAPPAVGDTDLGQSVQSLVFGVLLAGGYGAWLVVLRSRAPRPNPDAGRSAGATDVPDGAAEAVQRRVWERKAVGLSVYGSSMLFALFHPGGVPTYAALFLLGLGLGWLAQRTQSLVGCIVCHALFNVVACLVLYWTVAP
jgi:membrane protease YdiL (CAAX protease family)